MSITLNNENNLNSESWTLCRISSGEALENYKVSSYGYFKNVSTDRILKGHYDKHGHLRIKFKVENDYKYFTASRVIYSSFFPLDNIDNFDIETIDGDKTNLKLSNLKKSTRAEITRNERQLLTIRSNNKLQLNNIYKTKNKKGVEDGKYRVSVYKLGVRYSQRFNNIDDAIIYRNTISEQLRTN